MISLSQNYCTAFSIHINISKINSEETGYILHHKIFDINIEVYVILEM